MCPIKSLAPSWYNYATQSSYNHTLLLWHITPLYGRLLRETGSTFGVTLLLWPCRKAAWVRTSFCTLFYCISNFFTSVTLFFGLYLFRLHFFWRARGVEVGNIIIFLKLCSNRVIFLQSTSSVAKILRKINVGASFKKITERSV